MNDRTFLTHGPANSKLIVLLAALSLAVLAAAPGSRASANAEPRAYQIWTSEQPPRQGRVFVGATVVLLAQSAVTLRPESVRIRCTRGVIKPASAAGRARHARATPVHMRYSTRQDPGPVIAAWACLWHVPAGTAGSRLAAGVSLSAIEVDPVTGRDTGRSTEIEGRTLSWPVRR